jgi:hypothetical protein
MGVLKGGGLIATHKTYDILGAPSGSTHAGLRSAASAPE